MLWKRIALLTATGAALGAAAPAFAEYPNWAPDQGYRSRNSAPRAVAAYPQRYAAVAPRPVMAYRSSAYYGPPPMRAYRAPAYYGPRPYAYRGYRNYDYAASGALAGAVAGALIGGSVAYGDQQFAGAAIGSLLGAVIGHELAGGH